MINLCYFYPIPYRNNLISFSLFLISPFPLMFTHMRVLRHNFNNSLSASTTTLFPFFFFSITFFLIYWSNKRSFTLFHLENSLLLIFFLFFPSKCPLFCLFYFKIYFFSFPQMHLFSFPLPILRFFESIHKRETLKLFFEPPKKEKKENGDCFVPGFIKFMANFWRKEKNFYFTKFFMY